MIAIHIEFFRDLYRPDITALGVKHKLFRDLYAKLRASRCSIRVVKYILVTSKWSSGKNKTKKRTTR